MHTSQPSLAALTAEFAALSRKLIAVTESSERGTMLEEMRAILLELRVLIRMADSHPEFTPRLKRG